MQIPDIIASLDAEWVNANKVDAGLPATENRVLSYQITILNRTTGNTSSAIIEPNNPTKRGRRGLANLLGLALRKAVREDVIPDYPVAVALVIHFSRADLTHLRDWKNICRRMDAVRRTFTTTTKPFILSVPTFRGARLIRIIVTDTMLLAAAKMKSLERLGAALGLPKIVLPLGYSKDRMDLFKHDHPDLFNRYAITDTIIAAHWAQRVWKLLATDFTVSDYVPTLASAAVRMICELMVRSELSVDAYFGCEIIGRKRQHLACLTEVWTFAANAYHGGRNEAFHLGHSPRHRPLYDLDMVSAYTTAMAMLRVPHWPTATRTTNLADLAVVDEALTYARVRFEFPQSTRFPCLPVRAGDRGLIYPRTGTSWCTGPEIVVGRRMGATLAVEAGWRIDWIADSIRPFELFTQKINTIRALAKAVGDEILNELAKEIGNSCYGKIAQAVNRYRTITDSGIYGQRGKRVFNPRTEQMETLPPSRITCPMLAAFTTGLVRALMSEALASLPASAFVASVTTDGFLGSVPVACIDTIGPVASAFRAARARIMPNDAAIWEQKHRVGRVLVTKTRGTITTRPHGRRNAGSAVLARAGFRLERRFRDEWAECQAWAKFYRERTHETHLPRSTLTGLRDQWLNDQDLVDELSSVRLNLDFDMKRRIVEPVDVGGVITAGTEPWETVDQFHAARDALERWKKAQRRVLKTVQDYRDLRIWQASRPGLVASGSTAQSGRPPLVNLVLRAVARGGLGLTKWPNRLWAAFITACGWPLSEQTIKDARRRGKYTLGQLKTLTSEEVDFVEALLSVSPAADIESLMEPASPAATALAMTRDFVSAFDFHLPNQPEPGEDDAADAVAGGAFSMHHIGASAT
jgi:hypothetical protein